MAAKNLSLEKRPSIKAVEGMTYIPSEHENSFDQSEDPALPFKAMGTFWAVLIGLMITLSIVLLGGHRVHSPSQSPPNLIMNRDLPVTN